MDVNKTGRITYIMIISGLLCNTLINTVIFLFLIQYNTFIAQNAFAFCTIVDLDASFKVYLLSLKFITAIDKFEFFTILLTIITC